METTTTTPSTPSVHRFGGVSAYLQSLHKKVFGGLETTYCLFPFKTYCEVVDFWSQVFLGKSDDHSFFRASINERLSNLGLIESAQHATYEVSFSSGIIGVSRQMTKAANGRALTTVFFESVGDFLYVSLRVIYQPSLSQLRLMLHSLAILIWAGVSTYITFLKTCQTASYYDSYTSQWVTYSGCSESQRFMYFATALIIATIFLTLFRMGFSLVFNRSPWAWAFEDFDELYRDDLALIGSLTHTCILAVADELDLERVQVSDQEPPPAFANVSAIPSTYRRRRI